MWEGIMSKLLNEKEKLKLKNALYYAENKVAVLTRQQEYLKTKKQDPKFRERKIKSYHKERAKYPEKYRARYLLRSAIVLGKIAKQPCEVCGELKVESHHDDYSKPLEVRWLCHQHHCELEGRWIPRV
jgi:hypothetical protein